MLQKPKFRKFENPEFIAYFADVLELLNRFNNPTLAPFVAPLAAEYAELDNSFQIERGNMLTRDVQATDKRRDKAITGIKKAADAYRRYFDETVADAAERILRSINKYGKNIARLSYQKETAVLTNLIADWTNTPELAAALTTLNLDDWKNELETANTLFKSVYIDHVQDEAAKDFTPVTKLLPDAIKAYESLAAILNGFVVMDATTYEPIVKEINELVNKYDLLVA